MHKTQKKNTGDANSGLEVTSVLKTLHQCYFSFERETERVFYGHGKFRLAPGHEQFTENLQSVFCAANRERARSYEEISSVHTIYNRYVQKAIKCWFKSTTTKKDKNKLG